MLTSQRIFVDAIKKYCAARGIAVDVRSDGWLIVMQRGERRHFAFGYDIGLNSAIAHRIANDKSATAEVLSLSGIACVPHTFFLDPELSGRAAPARDEMLALLEKHPQGLVVKPNEGASGKSVFWVTSRPALELAVKRIFASSKSLAISPYLDIDYEVRVVLIDDMPAIVYAKERAFVTGDGRRSLQELAHEALPQERRAAVLTEIMKEFGKAELDAILPRGQRRALDWRHNLEYGAHPALLETGTVRETSVALAMRAARAIGIRFASIDVVRAVGDWQILEINSGVMMEALGRLHPELVHATYHAALDKIFE
jgi:glutathione synthase/RimK-type ligase-like ATP-grasp enzyme